MVRSQGDPTFRLNVRIQDNHGSYNKNNSYKKYFRQDTELLVGVL